MPYSGPDDPKLPSNVKKMDEKKRRQWVHVFNSAMKDGDESSAFAQANGVAKKEVYIGYEAMARQLDQGKAGYNAVGGNNEKACANCNWYVSPDGCILVGGTISPTGLSDYWLMKQEYQEHPIPVMIVEEEEHNELSVTPESDDGVEERQGEQVSAVQPVVHSKSIVDNIIDFAKGLLGKKQEPLFTLFKDNEGNLRFFAMPSNMYEDRQKQIITSEAHKDFVDWVDATGIYPQLWMWHIPGSRIGRCDWVDFTSDGMLCASGIIDKEFESVATSLAQRSDLGMSHGFFRFGDTPYINKYRAFEISILPRERAANFGTDFMLESKEMAFSEEKRKLLTDSGVSEDQIKQWEEGADKFGQQMKQMGIAWKEEETQQEAEQVSEIAQLTSVVSTLVEKVTQIESGLSSRVEAVEKSFDEKVEEAFTAQIAKMPRGYKPSEAADNVASGSQTKEDITNNTMEFFYGQVVGKVGQ